MKAILLLFCLFITGCALWNNNQPASPYDRRTEKMLSIDKNIESDIFDALNDDKELLRGSHLEINAYNKTVLLTGEVPSLEIKQNVANRVRIIKPIKQVYDYLSVDLASDMNSRANDTLITQNISNAFKQIHGLPYFKPSFIKVITTHGIVYLMGRVHRDEGDIVTKLTRLQNGVQAIVTLFEYLD